MSTETPVTLEVSEIFASLQGEGKFIGRPCVFLRLRRCNLACPKCDERHTWDENDPGWNEYKVWYVDELAKEIVRYSGGATRLVVTGGEPLIWTRQLSALFPLLKGWEFEIETNGTIVPMALAWFNNIHYNVSPKLPSFHDDSRQVIRWAALKWFNREANDTNQAIFKFVVSERRDFDDVWDIVKTHGIKPENVYIMPEGTDQITIINRLEWLFPECRSYGYNLTPRMHILAFGNQKGT